jgi:DNA repair exonuclease SbcCD nuclease subunit
MQGWTGTSLHVAVDSKVMTRILHLTDLHLREHQPGSASNPSRLSREMAAALDILAVKIGQLDVDLIALTGDLLDVPDEIINGGSPDGHPRAAWLEAVERDLVLIRDWFSVLAKPYVICPGNHDLEPAIAKVFPEATNISDAAGYRFFCFWDELGPDRQPRRTGQRLELFEQALTSPAHDVPQIHIQHYTIEPPILHNNWQYEYTEAQSMKQKLASSGRVKAVLSGHYHPGTLVQEDGVAYSGAPAFCESPHLFRILDFGPTGSINIEEHSLKS